MKHDSSSPIAAFFDFDETLLAIDSAGIGFKVLKEQGYLTKTFMLKMFGTLLLKKAGLIDEHMMARTFLGFYKGRDHQPFVEAAQQFYVEYLQPNLSPEVTEKLRWHQKLGHQTVLVTGSIDYYLKPVMQDLAIDHLLCSHLELDRNGVLTGRAEGPICVGEAKVTLAKALAKSHGIDLAQSYAYGNSELDIPMLKQVGHPVTVNPTPALTRHAKRYNWPGLLDVDCQIFEVGG